MNTDSRPLTSSSRVTLKGNHPAEVTFWISCREPRASEVMMNISSLCVCAYFTLLAGVLLGKENLSTEVTMQM